MKILFFILLSLQFALAQDLPGTTEPFLTENGLNPVPGTMPPEDSEFEKAVESAGKVPQTEDKKSIADKVSEKVEKIDSTKGSRDNREESLGTVMVGYQLITTWVPSKKTISYTHIFNGKWSLEGEYSWSTLDFPFVGIDLGEISEKRFSLMARYYSGNSFNFQFGPYFSDFEAQAGSDLLTDISGSRTTSSFGVENLGLTAGMGNRWQFDNGITFGVDWLRLNVPLITTEVDSEILSFINNEEDDDGVRKVIRRLSRIPTFVLFGLNIGYTF